MAQFEWIGEDTKHDQKLIDKIIFLLNFIY